MMRAGSEQRPYPVWLALVATALFVSPNLAVLLVGTAEVPEASLQPSLAALAVTLVLQLALFATALLPLMLTRRLDGRLLGTARPRWSGRSVTAGLAAGLAAAVGSYGVNAVLVTLIGTREPVQQQLLQDAAAGGPPLLLVATIAVVVAPITEEVVFRGVLFRSLADRLGPWSCIVISAAIFALIHIEVLVSQPAALAGLFVIGAVLAAAYHRTGNLVVPILGHATFNAMSLGLALVLEPVTTTAAIAALPR